MNGLENPLYVKNNSFDLNFWGFEPMMSVFELIVSAASEKKDEKSETLCLAFCLQVFLGEVPDVFLQFRSFQYLDVIGKPHVETSDTFKLVHIVIEIPDVIVSLMWLDIVPGCRKLLYEQVFPFGIVHNNLVAQQYQDYE